MSSYFWFSLAAEKSKSCVVFKTKEKIQKSHTENIMTHKVICLSEDICNIALWHFVLSKARYRVHGTHKHGQKDWKKKKRRNLSECTILTARNTPCCKHASKNTLWSIIVVTNYFRTFVLRNMTSDLIYPEKWDAVWKKKK